MTDRQPTVIIAGCQKGATTSLFDWLGQHPDVYAEPSMKDFPYYCDGPYADRDLDWFAKRFSGAGAQRHILHGYVHYLRLATQFGPRIRADNPSVKLILSLRDPVQRAHAGYLEARKTGIECRPSFEEAISDDLNGHLDGFESETERAYFEHGLYGRQLQQLLPFIERNNLLVLFFDDVVRDPARTCARCFQFLDVNPSVAVRFSHKNEFGVARSSLIQQALRLGLRGNWLKNAVPLGMRIRARRKLESLNTRSATRPALCSQTEASLRRKYLADKRLLERLLQGQRVPW